MRKLILPLLAFLSGIISFAQENLIATISHDPGWCAIIHRWGFIGDSLCSGEHESKRADGKTTYHDIYEYSWGQRICAATGAKGENYSQGGETTRGWIDHFWNYPLNRNADIDAKVNLQQAYIIALGVNDFNSKMSLGSVKKDVDFGDFTKNADTYVGNYCGIIQRVRSLQPKARFFVVTMPEKKYEDYNEFLRTLPEYFENLYVLDIAKYGPDYSNPDFKAKYYRAGHLNAAGYQLTAWMFMTYINWIIENNLPAFEDIALVP